MLLKAFYFLLATVVNLSPFFAARMIQSFFSQDGASWKSETIKVIFVKIKKYVTELAICIYIHIFLIVTIDVKLLISEIWKKGFLSILLICFTFVPLKLLQADDAICWKDRYWVKVSMITTLIDHLRFYIHPFYLAIVFSIASVKIV